MTFRQAKIKYDKTYSHYSKIVSFDILVYIFCIYSWANHTETQQTYMTIWFLTDVLF